MGYISGIIVGTGGTILHVVELIIRFGDDGLVYPIGHALKIFINFGFLSFKGPRFVAQKIHR